MTVLARRIDTARWAEFWGVNARTIQRWAKDGLPVDEPVGMARHVVGMARPALAARAKAEAILIAEDRSGGFKNPELKTGGLGISGEKTEVGKVFSREEVAEAVVDLELAAKTAWKHYEAAIEQNDWAGINRWSEEFRKMEKARRDEETHRKKMGVDEGAILPRKEVCRLVRALAFWMVQSVEAELPHLAPKILEIRFVEEAWDVLDRFLMRKRFLAAFSKALTTPSGVQLPDWLMDEMVEAVEDYFDPEGEEERREFEAFMEIRKDA